MRIEIRADAIRCRGWIRPDVQLGDRELTSRIGRLEVLEPLHNASRALLGPVGAGNVDADEDVDRPLLGEQARKLFCQRDPRGQKGRPDVGLARIVARSDIIVVDRDDDDALGPRVGDDLGEGVVVRKRQDQRVRVGGERRIDVGQLFLNRHVRVGEDHLTVGLDLAAGVFEAFLDRLPEFVRGRTVNDQGDFDRIARRRRGRSRCKSNHAQSERQAPHRCPPRFLCGSIGRAVCES